MDTVSRLILVLQNFKLEPTPEEVADWLWFAAQQPFKTRKQRALESPISKEQNFESASQSSEYNQLTSPDQPQKSQAELSLPTSQKTSEPSLQGGSPFQASGGYALPHALKLGRALRPLIRRVPSPYQQHLDEEATAHQIAASFFQIWFPIYTPKPVRWLELALVIEESPSMRLWEQTIKEFKLLLTQQGAFHNIRVWRLKTTESKIILSSQSSKVPHHYKELVNSTRQRLILVVTDCIAPAWQDEQLLTWLNDWGRYHSVVLVQMLPQQLWFRTQLRFAQLLKVSMPYPAAPNRNLRRHASHFSLTQVKDNNTGLPVPITTLEANFLAIWAHFIISAGKAPAYVFKPQKLAQKEITVQQKEINVQQRFNKFKTVASPLAFQLACYLAAIVFPLNLSIMRVVQQALLPESEQVHLAEFFLSGLIKNVSSKEVIHSEEINYEFIDESVRKQLLDASSKIDRYKVEEVIAHFIERSFSASLNVPVLAHYSDKFNNIQSTTDREIFARKILSRKWVKKIVAPPLPTETPQQDLKLSQNLNTIKQNSTPLSDSLCWLHLTDLHIDTYNQDSLLFQAKNIFFDDLEKLYKECGALDLVIITGDLTQSGEAEQFEQLNEFLEDLWLFFKSLGCNPKLIAIPGNHDRVRLQEDGKLLDDELLKAMHSEKYKAFKNYTCWWEQQPYKIDNCKSGILPGEFSVSFEKQLLGEIIKLGIVGLNSAFLQRTDQDYKGKLTLHNQQSCCPSNWIRQQNAYLIMTHHPISWLNTESQQYLNNILADEHCIVHLCGHLHKTTNFAVVKEFMTGRTLQGRSLFSLDHFGKDNQQRSYGYSIGQLQVKYEQDELYGGLKFYPREYRGEKMDADFDFPIPDATGAILAKKISFKALDENRHRKSIFINTSDSNRDIKLLQEIKDFLDEGNLNYYLPLLTNSDTKAEEIVHYTSERLASCDAVILIYHKDVPITWLQQQITLCNQSKNKRSNRIHELIAIFRIPPTKDIGNIQLPPNGDIFDCPKLKSLSCLLRFVHKLLS